MRQIFFGTLYDTKKVYGQLKLKNVVKKVEFFFLKIHKKKSEKLGKLLILDKKMAGCKQHLKLKLLFRKKTRNFQIILTGKKSLKKYSISKTYF